MFRNELTACLALVAPAGMTEEGRRDWLTVAWETLGHIPPDLLAWGAKIARQKCDHPSKIVPTIIAETADAVRWRRERVVEPGPEPLRLERPDYCTPDEAAKILEDLGIRSAFRTKRDKSAA